MSSRTRIAVRALAAAALLSATAASAAVPPQTAHRRSPYVGAIALDAITGRVLLSDAAERECYPASCTKLMTARLLLKAVAAGSVSLEDSLVQSKRSSREEPSKIDLAVGEKISVDNALKALMVKSANDVAVMIAERVGGTVEGFVGMMNAEARRLGMNGTTFASPNGLPPPRGSKRGFDRSTARDMAILGRAILIEQPEMLRYTSLVSITIPGRGGAPLTLRNHNHFLWDAKAGVKMPEVDGLKTGYIDAGGSSIVLTGVRNGKRALVVVVGSASRQERELHAGRLLSDALGAIDW